MHLEPSAFEPVGRRAYRYANDSRDGFTYWGDAWARFKRNRLAVAGLWIIILIGAMATAGPLLSPYSYSDQYLESANQPPSLAHPFGTDNLGRDLFVRVMYGARISLAVGFAASAINLTIGVVYGSIAGYAGGRVDDIMMRAVDILYGIPMLLIVIMLMMILGPGLVNIFIALGIGYWLDMARIVRGQVLSLKEREYVLAARLMGASTSRIMARHLIPNSIGPILVTATVQIPHAIFTEAFLSYIGLGVSAPMSSWGVLASEGTQSLMSYPWQLLFPGAAICLAMLGFNFLGDGLRDALDPQFKR